MMWYIGIWCGEAAYGVGIGTLCWVLSHGVGYRRMMSGYGIWCGLSAYGLGYRHMVWGNGI